MTRALFAVGLLAVSGPLCAYECPAARPDDLDARLSWDLARCHQRHLREAEQRAWRRHQQDSADRAPARVDEVQERLARLPAGTQFAGLATTLLGTLPDLGLLGLADGVEQADPDVGAALRLDALGAASRATDLLLQPGVQRDPRVFPPLAAALRDAGAQDELDKLQRDLQATDALELGLTVAVIGEGFGLRFGRDARRYRELFAALAAGASSAAEIPAHLRQAAEIAAGVDARDCPWTAGRPDMVRAGQPLDELAGTACLVLLNRAFARHAQEREARVLGLYERRAGAMLDAAAFENYISNSAQLHLALRHVAADSVVESRASGARLSVEIGLGPSIDGFLAGSGGDGGMRHADLCRVAGGDPKACFEAFEAWAKAHPPDQARHNQRIAFYLEAMHIQAVDISVDVVTAAGGGQGGALDPLLPPILDPGDDGGGNVGQVQTVEVSAPAITRFRVGLNWGYALAGLELWDAGRIEIRLEAGGEYSFFDTEAVLRNSYWRVHAGPVIAFGRYSLPLQLYHQSRAEFRVEDDPSGVGLLGGLRMNF